MILQHRKRSAARVLVMATLLVCVAASGDLTSAGKAALGSSTLRENWQPAALESFAALSPTWNVKTHVFAANIVLADVQADGKVTIPPFGEFTVNPELVQALRKHADDYRSGVVGPDVFPDIYVGQSYAHVDHWCDPDHWIADGWMRQAFDAARSSTDPEDLRLRRLAFAYGFLTHGAQDMFGHTFINHYVGAKYGSYTTPESLKADARHVVLESYVAKHTPMSDLTINVDDRFQAENLIKPAVIKAHTLSAPHYQSWLGMYNWLGKSIDQTFNAVGRDTSFSHCYSSTERFKNCQELFYMIGWRKDIDRGLRHLVDANKQLGDAILAGDVAPGIDALVDWTTDWLPKMYGLHALGEFDQAMGEFMDWWTSVNPTEPIDKIISKAIMQEVEDFLAHNFSPQYAYFQMVMHPSQDLNQLFPADTAAMIRSDMHMGGGADSLVNWGQFDALYNTVVASKLVLLDGDGLNELARRAGLTTPLYGSGPGFNIMIGVMRSMDGDHQWDTVGDHQHNYGLPFARPNAPKQVAGASSAVRGPQLAGSIGRTNQPRTDCRGAQTPPEPLDSTGYAYFQAPGAREKIFQYIFRGWGPPGAPLPPPLSLPVVPVVRALPYDALASDVDTLQRSASALLQRSKTLTQITPLQLSVLQHPKQGVAPRAGSICCSAAVQTLRSALTDLQTDARHAGRVARRNGDASAVVIVARILTEAGTVDAQTGAVLTTADAASAQEAAQQVSTSVTALASLVAQLRR